MQHQSENRADTCCYGLKISRNVGMCKQYLILFQFKYRVLRFYYFAKTSYLPQVDRVCHLPIAGAWRHTFRAAGRSSDFRIVLLPAPSHTASSTLSVCDAVALAGFVPVYSGGSVPDCHRLPYMARLEAANDCYLVFGRLKWHFGRRHVKVEVNRWFRS